MLMYWKK